MPPVNKEDYQMLHVPEGYFAEPADASASSSSPQLRTLCSTAEMDMILSKLSEQFESDVDMSAINLQPQLAVMDIGTQILRVLTMTSRIPFMLETTLSMASI